MRRRSVLKAAVGLAASGIGGCATWPHRDETTAMIDAVDLDGAPGASIAVVRARRIVALGGKGVRGPHDPVAPGADTIFEIGSLTKTFTASLIFELEAEGRLNVNAPIGTYVPELPDAWRPVTLAALLSHTSGLPEYLDQSNFQDLIGRDLTPREIVAIAADKPVTFAAGSRHAYNNTGFILLGMAAETVGGESYWDQLNRRFFRPARMDRTGPRDRLRLDANWAKGRFWTDDAWDDNPPVSAPGALFAAGGLSSTARDLARWAVALDRGALLAPRARDRMWRPAALADGTAAGWGHGWMVEQDASGTVVSHGGGTAGFSCWMRRDIETPLTTIVLTNQNGRADPLMMTNQMVTAL